MPWVESVSPSFRARFDERDAQEAERVLDQLERARDRLSRHFARAPGDLTVVVHDSSLALSLAQPYLPLARMVTAPAGRRYLAGWFGASELHVLAPRLLEARASGVPGSRELLALTPTAMYASVVVGANNPELPPPFTVASFRRYLRWAWLAQGAAQYFAGQVAHLRPAIARRLREGGAPDFPPGVRDAALLGGTVFDLLAREAGDGAAAALAGHLDPQGAHAALTKAFGQRSVTHTAGMWRAHLARLGGATSSQELGAQPGDDGHQREGAQHPREQPRR